MVTTHAFRAPDGRIAVPIHGRNDVWLMISWDGSVAVGLGELSAEAGTLISSTEMDTAYAELRATHAELKAERAARQKIIQMIDEVISESNPDLRDSLMIQLGTSGLLADRSMKQPH